MSQLTLAERAETLGVPLGAEQVRRLEAYLDAVLEINKSLNLTAVRDRDGAVLRHLLDSLTVVPVWHAVAGAAPPRRVLDLGTGGGFPGAVLAVAWPASRVLMIDGTGKKVRAVTACLAQAGIVNAQALQVRGNDLPKARPGSRGASDLCVARAVGPAEELVRELAPLTAPRGFVFLMKGPKTSIGEIEAGEREAKLRGLVAQPAHVVDVPGLEARKMLVYRKG